MAVTKVPISKTLWWTCRDPALGRSTSLQWVPVIRTIMYYATRGYAVIYAASIDVRFRSNAELAARPQYVRCSRQSRNSLARLTRPFGATSRGRAAIDGKHLRGLEIDAPHPKPARGGSAERVGRQSIC
jgi:hypothetical protein